MGLPGQVKLEESFFFRFDTIHNGEMNEHRPKTSTVIAHSVTWCKILWRDAMHMWN